MEAEGLLLVNTQLANEPSPEFREYCRKSALVSALVNGGFKQEGESKSGRRK